MKPRTKLQIKVFELSNQLANLTDSQKEWAYKNCLKHIGYRTSRKTSCLDCGHIWPGQQKVKSCKCPNCHVKIEIKDSLKRKLDQHVTFAIVDQIEEFQVNRFFEVKSQHNSGWIPELSIREIVQQWFKLDGKLTIVGRTQVLGNSGFSGNMEIRANISNYYNSNKYDIYADKIYPMYKCLPIYKRNGFNSKIEDVQLYSMFAELIRDSKLETLLKANQYSLFAVRLGNRENDVYKFWDSIKICIRNKYIIKDASSYLDYLELLSHYGKDLRNLKYVCPGNFHKEHNRLVSKRAKEQRIIDTIRKREQAEKRKLLAEQEQLTYQREKCPYFGIVFSEGELTIKVLESIQDFITEADHHQHCIYTNQYYNKPDSLCFSAKIDGKPVETIELSLANMKIIQSRGIGNKPSIHHDKIIDLMNKNIRVIRKIYSSLKKEAA